ncbi:MAG: glycosyltransferase [Actinobacteria bacterium]|nr:glycosyltransferase [Actinomycetota bacterium]
MSDSPLRIALVSPHAFPPGDDVGHAVAAEAEALARRGHAVTILAPGKGRQAADAGRRRIEALEAGDADAVAAGPGGPPLLVATSRAIRKSSKGTGRRLGGPIESASGLEIALGLGGFDVAHLHEPLAPSPALAALRHATGIRAVTFHRTAPLAGVAFVRPLVDRALAQADLRIALSPAARHVLAGVLPGEYEVVPEGLDPALFGPPADHPGIVVVARDRDRTGLRFVLRALVGTDPAQTGPITIIGPPDAPQRTRTAVPKALRDRVRVVPDAGAVSRAEALREGRIALFPTDEEAGSPVLREAMAASMCVLAARCPDADDALGTDAGMTLPPFNAEAWADAVASCLANPARVALFGAAAEVRGRARAWDDVAVDLEQLYRGAVARPAEAAAAGAEPPVFADLRVRTGPGLGPREIVATAVERDIRVVAVAAPGGIEPALEVHRAAPERVRVIVGQEIDTREGVIVGLFLTHSVPDGLALDDSLRRVRDQGGITVIPHPDSAIAPPAESLRGAQHLIDCHEGLTPMRPAAQATDAALLLQRAGLVVTAGSAAAAPAEMGTAGVLMRPFAGPEEFLAALGDARPVRRRRGLRGRSARSSRRASQQDA